MDDNHVAHNRQRSAPFAIIPRGADASATVQDPRRLAQLPAFSSATVSELDALAQVTAATLHAPRALVSIIDAADQHVVGSFGYGAGVPPEPVDDTVCAFTITLGEPVLLGDLEEPGVAEALPPEVRARVRSYAGTSLRIAGERVGTLCVTDDRPHAWTLQDADRLEMLATIASRLLDRPRPEPPASG